MVVTQWLRQAAKQVSYPCGAAQAKHPNTWAKPVQRRTSGPKWTSLVVLRAKNNRAPILQILTEAVFLRRLLKTHPSANKDQVHHLQPGRNYEQLLHAEECLGGELTTDRPDLLNHRQQFHQDCIKYLLSKGLQSFPSIWLTKY